MRSESQEVPLGDVAEFQEGYVNPPQSNSRYFDGQIKWLRAVDLNNGFVSETSRTLTREGFDSAGKSAYLFPPETLAISKSGTIGRLGILKDWMCGNRAVINIRPKQEVADTRFVFYSLMADPGQIDSLADGSVQRNLYISQLSRFCMRLPALTEQRHVSSILGAIDNKIANNRALAADLEAMARAIFKSWFVDFDPVKAKMEGRAPAGMDADTAALFPDELVESELGLIPKGWEVGCLTDAFELNPRCVLKKGVAAPYLEMSKVPVRGHVPDEVVLREFSSGTKFRNGDSLLARITPCLENGKAAHVDFLADEQIGWGSTEFIVMRAKPPVPVYFGYLLCRLEAFREHAISSMTGTSGRQRVQPDSLARWQLAIPTGSICKRFEQIIDPLRARIRQLGDESQELTQLRDTLLPRLISGKLRLPESEAAIAEATA